MASECSVVVPLHNEAYRLPTLHARLMDTLQRLAIPFEVIYVDNGSTDETAELIAAFNEANGSVKGIILSRRFRRQAAVSAGLEAANGRSVITIDGNLEDPPEIIPQLLDAWNNGYEVVFARRKRRRGALERTASLLCHRFLRLVSEIKIPTDTGELVLMDRRAVDELNRLPERSRFVTGLRSWVGFRQTVLEYDRPAETKFTAAIILARQVRTVIEGLFAFSSVPLKAVTLTGVALLVGAIVGLTLTLLFSTFGQLGASVLLILTVVGGLGGVQLICLGVLGEYLARIYQEVRGRPLYVCRAQLGFRQQPRAVRSIAEFLPTEVTRRQEAATEEHVRAEWSTRRIGLRTGSDM